jgi:hypothetical protein
MQYRLGGLFCGPDGRSDVTLYKLDGENYYMDFQPTNK